MWKEMLTSLRGQMTKATFDTLFLRSNGYLKNGSLVIEADNAYAADWLERRFQQQIKRSACEVLGKEITNLEFVVKGKVVEEKKTARQTEMFEVSGTYVELYNKIVRPKEQFWETEYFRKNWVPRLGPVLAWLIVGLRRKCYYNPNTGEKRDVCKFPVYKLAEEVGVSLSTASRHLNNPQKKEIIDLFILDRSPIREYSHKKGRVVTVTTIWRIRLDDPLTPEDTLILKEMQK